MTTLSQARAALQAGETTPLALVEHHLSQFEEKNPSIGALVSYDAEKARADAEQADLTKPLGGIPIVLKDNINALGHPCTCSSKFLASGYTAPYDATVTRKLREAGAILLGRANMDEFAMGSATENSALANTVNPSRSQSHSRVVLRVVLPLSLLPRWPLPLSAPTLEAPSASPPPIAESLA